MRITLRTIVVIAMLSLLSRHASAQAVTEIPGLSLAETLTRLTGPVGSAPVGEALGFATALEVATTPFGTSSGGFVFKLDPSTGLQVRTATTFGPSFAERALTSGEGKVSVGVNLISASYTKLGDLSIDNMRLGSVEAGVPSVARVGTTSLTINSETLVISGAVGVTDKVDIGVSVPLVRVKLSGVSTLVNGAGNTVLSARGAGTSSGVGDIAAVLKYRLLAFGEEQPDPGGLTLLATTRLPTGDRESLRGLGVARTLLSLVVSSGQGRIRPHANGGFEWWNEGVHVVTNFDRNPATVTARHQLQYAGGIEIEAAPKLTLMVDLLGRHILGAGKIGYQTTVPTVGGTSVTSFESAVALPEGIQKITLVPGLKVNLKGNLLLSLNALTALRDTGLHARFTPVVGIDLTF
jgi:hypothetical protein